MKQSKKTLGLAVLTCLSFATLVVAQTYMLFVAQKEITGSSDKITGSVGLRQYFDSGSGSESDPYIITRPTHLYNLSRLQSLGAFPTTKYFQVGKLMEDGDTAYKVYKSDSSSNTQTTLDMTDYRSLISIGSTSSPFFGIMDGKNIVIKGLTIDSEPEDIGVFGYISSGASVSNMVFSDLTVTDKGYSIYLSSLFSPTTSYDDVAGILTCDTTDITTDGLSFSSLSFTDLSKSFSLHVPSGLPTQLDTTISGVATSFPISYNIRTTNDGIFNYTTEGQDFSIDTSGTGSLYNNVSFTQATASVSIRFYVTANVTISNIRYAKIVSTFDMVLGHNGTEASGETFDMSVYREPDTTYNYSHNTNIGFIAGHTDGGIHDSYVYNGKFVLNQSSTSDFVHQKAESENCLVGEVGINIDNKISPASNYESAGDTGIINFDSIYSNVRDKSVDSTGSMTEGSYTYYFFDQLDGNLYDDYLRKKRAYNSSTSTYYYQCITDADKSIDFIGRQIIKEDDTYSRGLGIFQLNTANADYDVTQNYANGLGDFAVTYDPSQTYSTFYYSTAELDATSNGTVTPSTYYGTNKVTDWKPNSDVSSLSINTGTTLPLTSGVSSFDSLANSSLFSSPSFETNTNYLIKSTLSSSLSNYYFSNTSSTFLKDYFTYKLKDKLGSSIASTSSDFGLMIKEKSGTTFANTTNFSSYLKLTGNNGTIGTVSVTDGDTTVTVPSKAIQFTINNDYGANITVLASSEKIGSSTTNTSNYLCLYKEGSTDGYRPDYAMYLPNSTVDDTDSSNMPYYFNYDETTRNITSTKASLETNGSYIPRLYAHTFYIPQAGTYFLGTPTGTSYVYYIAVQGQNGKGNLGGRKTVYIGTDTIDNMDFLLYDPEKNSKVAANIYIAANFSADTSVTPGTFQVTVNNPNGTYDDTNQTGTNKLKLVYDDSLTSALIQNATKSTFSFGTSSSQSDYSSSYVKYNWN